MLAWLFRVLPPAAPPFSLRPHMIRSAVTVSLVPEMRGGPFVFWDDLEASCASAAELGFDAVELFFPDAASVDAVELKQVLTKHSMAVAAFGSGAGWVKHKLRLTDPDAEIRRRAVGYIAKFIDLAAPFHAPVIIGSMQGRSGDGVSREQAADWLAEALNELGERAGRYQLPVLYEFLNRYETNLFNNVEQTLAFVDSLRTSSVKLLCDLFHMNIEEADIAGALRLAGSRVGHVHFADSNRRAMGFGHTTVEPIARALRDIGYNGFISAEILPLPNAETAARQTLAAFRQFFR
jgi:sugar phosphate isomerase/epimerase